MTDQPMGYADPDETAARRLRVFLVDDHAMFRAGVRAELGVHVDVVGEASTVAEAVTRIAAVQPDVVLLDVHMPDGGGRAVLAALTEALARGEAVALVTIVALNFGALLGPIVAFSILALLPGKFNVVFIISFMIATLGVLALVLFVQNHPSPPDAESSEKALFADLSYELWDRLTLSLGGASLWFQGVAIDPALERLWRVRILAAHATDPAAGAQ